MTLLCNMQCLHCGSRAGKRRHNELSEGECLNIADQLIEMGNEHVTLIGGEILLVPHWYKIAKHFISAGVDANIITNAYKIGPQQIQDLRNSGIKDIGISIDGLSKTHDFIRNKKGSFKNAIDAINKLKEENNAKNLKTCIICLKANEKCYIGKTICLGETLDDVASNLFDALIQADEEKCDIIYSESFTNEGIGCAIMNRLLKSAGYKIIGA